MIEICYKLYVGAISSLMMSWEEGRGKKTDPYSPRPGKRVTKRKPESRRKRGEKIQEIVDLLDGYNDDKSRAEIEDKVMKIVNNMDDEKTN